MHSLLYFVAAFLLLKPGFLFLFSSHTNCVIKPFSLTSPRPRGEPGIADRKQNSNTVTQWYFLQRQWCSHWYCRLTGSSGANLPLWNSLWGTHPAKLSDCALWWYIRDLFTDNWAWFKTCHQKRQKTVTRFFEIIFPWKLIWFCKPSLQPHNTWETELHAFSS